MALTFQNQVNDGSIRTGYDPPGRLPTSLSLAGLPGQERTGSSEHPKPGRPRVRAEQLSKACVANQGLWHNVTVSLTRESIVHKFVLSDITPGFDLG
jgi:hypothetical protein